MDSGAQALIADLDQSLKDRSDAQRGSMLSRVTDLFVAGAPGFSADHVHVFDEVMTRLIAFSKRDALVETSSKLAPLANAPAMVVARLARNDDATIAVPLLSQSSVLTERDLAEVAGSKGQAQMTAVAGRGALGENVTDALLQRGNREIFLCLAANTGARFSELGMVKIVYAAKGDKDLAVAMAKRDDVPAEMRPFLTLADPAG
jgi:uncharacterized protein (DUF2336 family)